MCIYSTRPITLTNLHTYPLSSRKSKVNVRDFAKPPAANPSLNKFLASLPNFLSSPRSTKPASSAKPFFGASAAT